MNLSSYHLNRLNLILVCLLDKCGELPDVTNLETETQFPVFYSTPVTVKCGSGYSLEGSDVITCIKEKNYKSIDGKLPACNESMYFRGKMKYR